MKVCPTCQKQVAEGSVCPDDGTPVQIVVRSRDPLIGTTLKERWRLEEQIGRGGMGAIYKATDVRDGTTVAVKVLISTPEEAAEHTKRFQQEAEMLSQLDHPNVVRMLESGSTADGRMYLVMEYLRGRTLEQVVPSGQGIPVDSAVGVMEEVCAGVAAAHQARLVHRDLKPENIFIARQEDGTAVVKVIDFGLARAMETDEHKTSLTMTGKVVGSAGYVAPEHILGGRNFTDRSDTYALGAILYFMLTGRKPYAGQSIGAIMEAQVKEKPPTLGLPDDHPAIVFEPVVRRAMARLPEKRFATTTDLMNAINGAYEHVDHPPIPRTDTNTVSVAGMTISLKASTLKPSDRRTMAFGMGVAAGLALLLIVMLGLGTMHRQQQEPVPPEPAPSTAP